MIGVGLTAASYGFTMGIQGVETGRQQSTALFLAQQRMDQVKAAGKIASEPPLAYVSAVNCPAEAYNTITSAAKFRRTVTLTSYTGPPADCRRDCRASVSTSTSSISRSRPAAF